MTGSQPFADAADTWNKRFETERYIFGVEPNDFLREQAPRLTAGNRALCVADGEGRNSVWLARQGLLVDAFDISDVALRKARRLAEEAQVTVHFDLSDCDGWAWPAAAYDLVAAIFVQFADPAMRERLFANMVRSLKPGGLLVLQGYTPKQLDYRTGGPSIPSHLYTAELLQSAFEALQIIELRDYEAELTEGAQHHGRSALIGMVARKP